MLPAIALKLGKTMHGALTWVRGCYRRSPWNMVRPCTAPYPGFADVTGDRLGAWYDHARRPTLGSRMLPAIALKLGKTMHGALTWVRGCYRRSPWNLVRPCTAFYPGFADVTGDRLGTWYGHARRSNLGSRLLPAITLELGATMLAALPWVRGIPVKAFARPRRRARSQPNSSAEPRRRWLSAVRPLSNRATQLPLSRRAGF